MDEQSKSDFVRAWLLSAVLVSLTGAGIVWADRVWWHVLFYADPDASAVSTGLAFLWLVMLAIVLIEGAAALGAALARTWRYEVGLAAAHGPPVLWWVAIIVMRAQMPVAPLLVAPAVVIAPGLLLAGWWAITARSRPAILR